MIGSSSVAAGQGCSWKKCQGANGSEYLGRCMPDSAGPRGCGSFFFSYSYRIWRQTQVDMGWHPTLVTTVDKNTNSTGQASSKGFFWLGCPFLKLWYHPLSKIIIYYDYYSCIEGFPTKAAKCYEWQVGLGRVRGPHSWRFDLVGRRQD